MSRSDKRNAFINRRYKLAALVAILIVAACVSLLLFPSVGQSQAATLPGDVNADNRVDITDLSILLSQFSKPGSADINGNGSVDITDLSILLSNFGRNTVPPTGFSRDKIRWSWTGNFFGYNSTDYYNRGLTSNTYEGAKGMNMKHMREDRNLTDASFLQASQRGAKVFPILGGTVNDSPASLVASTKSMVERYGRGGTFWQAGQPGAAYAGRNLEVDWIEWINEPYGSNMGGANMGLAAAPKYAALVKSAYTQTKAADWGKKVKIGVSFDLTYFDAAIGGQGTGNWIRDMAQGGGGVPGTADFYTSGGYYDALSIHPYGGTNCSQTDRWCFNRVKEIVARIDALDGTTGAHAKEIWFSEDGAGTSGQLAAYQNKIAAMENDPILKALPVTGWSWHHYRDYTGWDQGLTVNGYLDTRKPAFDWLRDNVVSRTPAHRYEGQ